MPSLWKTWFGNVYFDPSGKWRGNVYFADPLENTVMVMSTLPSSSPRRLGRFGRRESRKIVYAGSVRFPQGIREFAYWALMGASWRPLGACWRPLGSSWGHLGASWSARGLSWAVWSSSLRPLEASGSRRGPARHWKTWFSWL